MVQFLGRASRPYVFCINENFVTDLERRVFDTIGVGVLTYLFPCSFEAFETLLVNFPKLMSVSPCCEILRDSRY